MKYCQGTKCHEYRTKDRIRGTKGSKYYTTRRRSDFHYGNGNFCDQRCMYDWVWTHIDRALDHFGRVTEAKRVMCDDAWFKDSKYNYNNGSDSNYSHYLVNDLLGERIPITEQQYQDDNIITPNNLSQ